jgi:hypothetical protein
MCSNLRVAIGDAARHTTPDRASSLPNSDTARELARKLRVIFAMAL